MSNFRYIKFRYIEMSNFRYIEVSNFRYIETSNFRYSTQLTISTANIPWHPRNIPFPRIPVYFTKTLIEGVDVSNIEIISISISFYYLPVSYIIELRTRPISSAK